MKPLLSIIIATKNRVQYCINSIETILSFPEKNFELVVQDNTDNFDLRDYINSHISDSRLIYNYTPPPFSSIDNFNAALDLASGEYLCLIGDDDSVSQQIIGIVSWAREKNIESICPQVFSEYIWPETFGNYKDSTLMIPQSTAKITEIDPADLLHEFFKAGALDYLKKGFPKLYHGIIKKSCLDKIKTKTGFYIGGLSPDIYAAISLSCVVKSHVLIDVPLTIAGACKASATVASINGQHSGDLKNAPHFRDRGNYVWDSLIPKIYSVETIWAETALKALTDMGREDVRKVFNSNLFMVKNILRNTKKLKYFLIQTYAHLKENKNGFIKILKLIYVLSYLTIIYFFKNILKLQKSNKKNITHLLFKDIHNIKEANNLTTKILNDNKITLAFTINEDKHPVT